MTSRADREFHREMVEGADQLKREIGYNPTRFNQMLSEHGGRETGRQLLKARDASDGFTTLWEAGQFEMSVETAALFPRYQGLFTDDQRSVDASTAHRASIRCRRISSVPVGSATSMGSAADQ